MRCNNCGNLINNDVQVCSVCGTVNNQIEVLNDINNVDNSNSKN